MAALVAQADKAIQIMYGLDRGEHPQDQQLAVQWLVKFSDSAVSITSLRYHCD